MKFQVILHSYEDGISYSPPSSPLSLILSFSFFTHSLRYILFTTHFFSHSSFPHFNHTVFLLYLLDPSLNFFFFCIFSEIHHSPLSLYYRSTNPIFCFPYLSFKHTPCFHCFYIFQGPVVIPINNQHTHSLFTTTAQCKLCFLVLNLILLPMDQPNICNPRVSHFSLTYFLSFLPCCCLLGSLTLLYLHAQFNHSSLYIFFKRQQYSSLWT